MKRKVVIWGSDHHNALGILRMLGGHGYDVFFLVDGQFKNIATASKYCKRYEVIQGIENGIEYLRKYYTDKDNKAVLLFTADKYSEAANNNLSLLQEYFYVSGPSKEGLLATVDDKYTMGEMASECGITTPETILYFNNSTDEVVKYPVVIKPCSPSAKDFKVLIIKNKKQLEKVKKVLIPQKRYVLQSYIKKQADGLIYGIRTWDGKTHLAGICVRNRWGDDGCGSFGYLTPDIPESVNPHGIKEFLQKIDFRGLFSVEYALTESGEAYFYEFNLRNDGTSVLFYNAGSNLALSFVNSCFGIEEEIPLKVNGKQFLMHEIIDKFNIYDGNVSRKQWLEDKKKVTLHFLYDPDDMKPYEIQKALTLKKFIHHIIARSWINKLRLKIRKQFNKR